MVMIIIAALGYAIDENLRNVCENDVYNIVPFYLFYRFEWTMLISVAYILSCGTE